MKSLKMVTRGERGLVLLSDPENIWYDRGKLNTNMAGKITIAFAGM